MKTADNSSQKRIQNALKTASQNSQKMQVVEKMKIEYIHKHINSAKKDVLLKYEMKILQHDAQQQELVKMPEVIASPLSAQLQAAKIGGKVVAVRRPQFDPNSAYGDVN